MVMCTRQEDVNSVKPVVLWFDQTLSWPVGVFHSNNEDEDDDNNDMYMNLGCSGAQPRARFQKIHGFSGPHSGTVDSLHTTSNAFLLLNHFHFLSFVMVRMYLEQMQFWAQQTPWCETSPLSLSTSQTWKPNKDQSQQMRHLPASLQQGNKWFKPKVSGFFLEQRIATVHSFWALNFVILYLNLMFSIETKDLSFPRVNYN